MEKRSARRAKARHRTIGNVVFLGAGHARASSSAFAAEGTMPQSEAGATHPRSRKASCITTKVSDGNLTKLRQLKAALYLRPVSLATVETPPSSSITSAVVESLRIMESGINPNLLDTQYPNLIDTKKFGYIPCSEGMGTCGTDEDRDVAVRCRALVRLYGVKDGEPNARHFAEEVIKIGDTRWGNILKSGALSRDVARIICRKIPETSLDWIYRGRDNGLSVVLAAEYQKAYRAAVADTVEQKPQKKPRKPKGPKKQSASG